MLNARLPTLTYAIRQSLSPHFIEAEQEWTMYARERTFVLSRAYVLIITIRRSYPHDGTRRKLKLVAEPQSK